MGSLTTTGTNPRWDTTVDQGHSGRLWAFRCVIRSPTLEVRFATFSLPCIGLCPCRFSSITPIFCAYIPFCIPLPAPIPIRLRSSINMYTDVGVSFFSFLPGWYSHFYLSSLSCRFPPHCRMVYVKRSKFSGAAGEAPTVSARTLLASRQSDPFAPRG